MVFTLPVFTELTATEEILLAMSFIRFCTSWIKQSHYRPGQAQRVLRKLRFPDILTTPQDGGRLPALRTGRLYPQEILLVVISVRG